MTLVKNYIRHLIMDKVDYRVQSHCILSTENLKFSSVQHFANQQNHQVIFTNYIE